MSKTRSQYIWHYLAASCLLMLLAACNGSGGTSGPQPTPTPFLAIQPYTFTGHTDAVTDEAWSPDERYIASSGNDKNVLVWDSATGKLLHTFTGNVQTVASLAWSPDSKEIAAGSGDGTVQIWDLATGKKVLTYQDLYGAVYAVAWSPDGKKIASGGTALYIWNAATGRTIQALNEIPVFGPTTIQWSPDSTRIAIGRDQSILTQVIDASTGKILQTYKGHHAVVCAVAWSPDGKFIVSGDVSGVLQVWNASTGAHIMTYKGHIHGANITSVHWLPDGQRIVSSSRDGTVQIWNATTGKKLFTYKDPTGDILAMAVSPDGSYVVTGGEDDKERVAKLV